MRPSLLANQTDEIVLTAHGVQGSAPLILSPCRANDAHVLAARFAAMLPWSRYPLCAAALEKYLAAQEWGAPRYAVRCDSRLIGALGLRLNWLRGPYIQFLGIMPEAQRSGAGAAILKRVADDAKAARERNVWVAASTFNADALRFYERCGFTRTALLDGLIQDDIDEVLLRQKL